jgi:hypothetical protein
MLDITVSAPSLFNGDGQSGIWKVQALPEALGQQLCVLLQQSLVQLDGDPLIVLVLLLLLCRSEG